MAKDGRKNRSAAGVEPYGWHAPPSAAAVWPPDGQAPEEETIMAEELSQQPEPSLDQYLTPDEPSWGRRFVAEQVRRAPWWTISLLVHLVALLVLWRWPAPAYARLDTRLPEHVLMVRKDVAETPISVVPPLRPPLPEPPPEPDTLPDGPLTPIPLPRGDQTVAPLTPPRLDGTTLGRPTETVEPVPAPSQAPVLKVRDDTVGRRPTNPWANRPKGGKFGEPDAGGGGVDPDVAVLINPIKLALIWLSKAQEPNGAWDAQRWDGDKPHRVGVTGLALLAYLGAGYTHRKGEFKATVGRALDWLRRDQKSDGSFGWKTFYEQGIATMAVCEAYGLTHDSRVGRMAQRAVDSIVRIQPEHGGFRYGGAVPRNEGDTSVTGWQIMAIKSAVAAKLSVPERAEERCHAFLENSWRRYGHSAYLVGRAEAGSLAVAAIGMLSRVFVDSERYDAEILETGKLLLGRETADMTPVPGGASKQLVRDLYYTYYSSLAMFQVGGEFWRLWRAMFQRQLVGEQVLARRDARGRPVRGSWDPARHRWGKSGGRVYATAMAALSLEVPFRYLPLYRQ